MYSIFPVCELRFIFGAIDKVNFYIELSIDDKMETETF